VGLGAVTVMASMSTRVTAPSNAAGTHSIMQP
jgi:hypothetical protein